MIIEELIYKHLSGLLSVPVFFEYPLHPPEKFVMAERVGGSDDEMIRTVSFALQSYADSIFEAAKLNEDVKTTMEKLIESPAVSRVDLDSDYNFTDTEMKKYRYQAIYDLVLF